MVKGTGLTNIREEAATVYYGGRRRFFKLMSACRAEARTRAKAKYGRDYGTEDGVDFNRVMHAVERLARLYARRYRAGRAALAERGGANPNRRDGEGADA